MTRPERAARLGQLREQLAAVTDEIARIEREDEDFVAYVARAEAAGQPPVGYTDFARYQGAWEQLETQWIQAGRPQNWTQLPLLTRLREVLLTNTVATVRGDTVPQATAPSAPAAPAAPMARPAPTPTAATPPPAQPAAGVAPAAGPAQPVRPAASAAVPAAPARPAASAPTQAAQAGPAAGASRGAGAKTGQTESLTEQHLPILNEVVELSKRAEEEFRLSQLPSGLASMEWALYLLERVYHAPPAMVNRTTRVLDDANRGAQFSESDRNRWELLRERVRVLAEAES